MRRLLLIFSSLIAVSLSLTAGDDGKSNRYNVLFIAVDDLRSELGCYGVKEIKTPQLDTLAKNARVFTNHFVQVPTCGSSRFALLSGRRPTLSGGYSNGAASGGRSKLKTDQQPGAQTLPELFKRSGYSTVCIGKVSHSPDGKLFKYDGKGDGRHELPNAWDELPTPYGPWKYGWGSFFAYGNGKSRETTSGKSKYRPVLEFPDVADDGLPDGLICNQAIASLKKLKAQKKPFFLAVGFYKPHLPFVAPKKYRDLYNDVAVKPPVNRQVKKSAYWHSSGEFFGYQNPFQVTRPFSEEKQVELKKAYYACVSYADAQIGKLLAALKEQGLEDDTIVVVWGDHGWHLGDHAIWGKHSPLDVALKSALIIRVPGVTGGSTDAVVETLDLYPTLVDYCKPTFVKTEHPLAGKSLRPVLDDAAHPGKDAAISYWGNGRIRSISDGRYRLIVKKAGDGYADKELYDHKTDPAEMTNVIDANPDVAARLLKLIEKDAPVMR